MACPSPPSRPSFVTQYTASEKRSWENVLYLQYPGLPEPSGWGGIILPGHFTSLSRAVTFMDYKNLTGQGNRAGFAAPQALWGRSAPAPRGPCALKDATA